MIVGTVTEDRQIIVALELFTGAKPQTVQAVLDTGFNGYLSLSRKMIEALAATPAGVRRAELGDGQIVKLELFVIKVFWCGAIQEILVVQAEATPLLGMAMVWGTRVVIEAQDNGSVEIKLL